MKKLIILIALLGPLTMARGENIDMTYRPFDGDKLKHKGVSAALVTGMYLLTDQVLDGEGKWFALVAAMGSTFVIGYTKEFMDTFERADKRLDSGDLVANGIGIGVAAAVICIVDACRSKKKRSVTVVPHAGGVGIAWRF